MAIDYDSLPLEDLQALKAGKYDNVSLATLEALKASSQEEQPARQTPQAYSKQLVESPTYRKSMADFIRKESPRNLKQEAVRGLPMGNRIADATLGTYNDPVYPERAVEKILGAAPYDDSSKLTPSYGKTPLEAFARGVKKFVSNPSPQIEGALAFPVDFAKGAYDAATSPEDGSLSRFAVDTAKGAIAPLNVFDPKGMNQAWEDNLLGSSLITTGAIKGAKSAGKATINTIPESFEMSMYQRGLKGQGPFNGLKTAELNNRLNTALNEGIPLNEKGVTKLKSTVAEINNEVQGRIANYADQGATVNINKVLAPVGDIRAKLTGEAFPEKATAQVNRTVTEFKNNAAIEQPAFDAVNTSPTVEIPIAQAQKFKQSINRELTDFYESMNKSPDKAGYLARQWVAKTKAKIGDGLRAEISEIFPEVRELNAREGSLIQLNKSLERAVNRIGQRDILSLKFITSMIASPKLAITEFILNNPNIQSNLAITIRQARRKANGMNKPSNPTNSTPFTPQPRLNQTDANYPVNISNLPVGDNGAAANSVPRIPLNLPVGDNGAAANSVPRVPLNLPVGGSRIGVPQDMTDPLGIRTLRRP